MTNVFISYSRKDQNIAHRLAEACKAQELNVWIDWERIEPTVDWWKEIEKGIEEADNFLFLLSPDSANSKVCKRELEHAVRNGKRLIPVVVRDVKADESPDELRPLNWIFLRESDDFETTFGKLIKAIETDYVWVEFHRRLQVRALEWERIGYEHSRLLRGKDMEEAESQLVTNPSKEPQPTDLQREYVLRSRQASDRQRRLLVSVSIGAAVVMAGLAVFGFVQAGNATREARIARAGELAAKGLAADEPLRSLLFSVEALQRLDNPEQRNSLLTSLQRSPRLKSILHGHEASVWGTAFSPDGKTFAAGAANGMVTLWNFSDPEKPVQLGVPLDSHTQDVWSVSFSPDGKILAAGTVDHTIVFWDVSDPANTSQLGEPLDGHFEDVRSVVYSPDGSTLASCGCASKSGEVCIQGEILLWDVSNPEAPRQLGTRLNAHAQDIQSLAFSPDGKTLASASWDNTVILWDISDPESPAQLGSPLNDHTLPALDVAFSADGKMLASGSMDGTVMLWDVSNPADPLPLGEPLKGQGDQVWIVAFGPDGKSLAAGGTDHQIVLWDVSNPETPTPIGEPLAGHTNTVLSVVFSPDGRTLASGSVDQTVILWSVPDTESPLQFGETRRSQVLTFGMDFSPDSKTLATGSTDSSVILWDASNPDSIQPRGKPLYGHNAGVQIVAFSPDGGTLASASCGRTDGQLCTQGEIILWNVSNPDMPVQLGPRLAAHESAIGGMVFSPNGAILASSSWDGTILLWDVSDTEAPAVVGQAIRDYPEYPTALRSLALSPDGKTLAASGDSLAIMLWDISNLSAPVSLGEMPVKHTNYVWSLAFSPDSRTLASGSLDQSVILWDVSQPRDSQQLAEPLQHQDLVVRVAFSPDGKMLASTSCSERNEDRSCIQGNILLWDVSSPVTAIQLGQPLRGHIDDVMEITFREDSRVLASSGLDSRIILWDVDPQSWMARACQKAGRNFTGREWTLLFPNEEYHATCAQWPVPTE